MPSVQPARLSVADTTFLQLDGPTTPMNIGVVVVLDGGPLLDEAGRVRLDLVHAHARATVHQSERNRQRPERVPLGLGRPVWVDVADFDVTDHVGVASLSEPTRTALLELAAEFFMAPLDARRPLWSNLVVDGLPDGQIALLIKVHHAVLDGASGLEAFAGMFSLTPDVVTPAAPEPWTPTPAPTGRRLVRDALGHQVRHAAKVARYAGRAARRPRRAVARVRRMGAALGPFTRVGAGVGRLGFNAPVGDRRRIATVALPLDDCKAVRAAMGCTVNDVLVAVVAGGLRRLLLQRGALGPDTRVTIMCPVSTRTAGDQQLGNELSALSATVDLAEPDPLARLRGVHDDTARAKREDHAAELELIMELGDFVTPAMLSVAAWSMHDQKGFNLSVSNLAGLPVPVWYLGARLREFYPIAPLMRRLGIMVTAFSHAGTLFVGINADADSVPDVDVLAEGIAAELAELRRCAGP